MMLILPGVGVLPIDRHTELCFCLVTAWLLKRNMRKAFRLMADSTCRIARELQVGFILTKRHCPATCCPLRPLFLLANSLGVPLHDPAVTAFC